MTMSMGSVKNDNQLAVNGARGPVGSRRGYKSGVGFRRAK